MAAGIGSIMESEMVGIYKDGTYLASNPTWHAEDSPYKHALVKGAIGRSGIRFSTCADVGCGSGLVVELLAKEYPDRHFIGFDVSPDARRFWTARRTLPNLGYQNADFLSGDGGFDLVTCLDVFEHVEDYFGFLRSLRTKARYFVFNIPLDMCVIKLLTPGIRDARTNFGHLHYFNSYTAKRTLEDCGYKIADTYISTSFTQVMPRSLHQAAVLPIRLLGACLGKSLCATLLGGASLVVVAASA